ncbi:uncharacterized protein LOC106873713 [Octopus bimaculoides]|uniref:uncharacterized protein LOC106873713 n=1 Tax=Octopus bimaculoides TaxID=37653 RepID=UPI00071C3AC3|nr:uncharacterized protein LOC106873713 [Octopus bimaculoides]|eukprot:XP_014776674.1 PREDICTED: uncharacterized protein LOC106873713 [Octopus bimaculoides]
MVVPDSSQPPHPESYVTRLREYFSNLPSMGPRQQSPPFRVPADIESWSHVFIRDDSVKGPLVSPYKGPYRVLSRTPKFFKVDANGRTEIVSVDRLKKAYLDKPSTPVFQMPHTPLSPHTLSTPLPMHTPTSAPSQ